MTWYAIVDATGEAVSFGTVIANPLPEGLTSIEVAGPPSATEQWDKVTRAAVARPVAPSAVAPMLIVPLTV
jgi:hypothetical protein